MGFGLLNLGSVFEVWNFGCGLRSFGLELLNSVFRSFGFDLQSVGFELSDSGLGFWVLDF